jgi:hypothetical protein
MALYFDISKYGSIVRRQSRETALAGPTTPGAGAGARGFDSATDEVTSRTDPDLIRG